MSETEELANCESRNLDKVGLLKDITNVTFSLTSANNNTTESTKEMASYQNQHSNKWNDTTIKDSLNSSCSANMTNEHIEESISDDSLHSIDTFRYINSSRLKCNSFRQSHKIYKRTIKTFRLVASQRDRLRKKYASSEHDETLLREIQGRRAKALDSRTRHDNEIILTTVKNQRKLRCRNRQKLLRKQKSLYEKVKYSSSGSSASEDETVKRHQLKPTKNFNQRKRNLIIIRRNQQKQEISPSSTIEKHTKYAERS